MVRTTTALSEHILLANAGRVIFMNNNRPRSNQIYYNFNNTNYSENKRVTTIVSMMVIQTKYSISTTLVIATIILFLELSHAYVNVHRIPFARRGKQTDEGPHLFGSESSNEWNIPRSESLPPLNEYTTKPVARSLPNGGRVTLLGSGPGDPDLLTVSAYKLLTNADSNTIVIVDRLVSPEILALIRCEYKVARKLPGCADLAQEEIYWWAYQALNKGKHVIRLKIGDPFVFGRGGEEVICFRRFGVDPVVIPGVSAAFSAPLLGNIPVTHRGVSNQVVMCTGYGRDGTSPDLIQYHKEQTIVFLMAVGRLTELCERLIRMASYPPTTPVAIVEKAGCPNQRTVVGNLLTIGKLAILHKIEAPSTIVVGEVVGVLLDENIGQERSGLVQNFTAGYVQFNSVRNCSQTQQHIRNKVRQCKSQMDDDAYELADEL